MSIAQDSLSISQKRPPSILVNGSNKDQSFRGSTINLKQVKFKIEPRRSSTARIDSSFEQNKKIDDILNEIAEKINEKNKMKNLLKLSKNINFMNEDTVQDLSKNEEFLVEFDQKYQKFLIEQDESSTQNRKDSSKSPTIKDLSGYSAIETTDALSSESNQGNTYSSSKDGTNSPTSKRTSTPSVDNLTLSQAKRIISPSIEISNISVTGTMYQFNNDNERTLTSFMDGSLEHDSQTLSAKEANATLDFTEDDEDKSALNESGSDITKNTTISSNRELSSSSSSSLFFGNDAMKTSNTPPLSLSFVPASMINNNSIKSLFNKKSSNKENNSDYSFNNGLVRELSNSVLGGRMSQKSIEIDSLQTKNTSRRSRTKNTPTTRSNTLPNRLSKPFIQRCNSLSTTKINETNPVLSHTKKIKNNFQFKQSPQQQSTNKSTGHTKISIPIYDSNTNRYLNNNDGRISRRSIPIEKNTKSKCKKKSKPIPQNELENLNILNSKSINAYENNMVSLSNKYEYDHSQNNYNKFYMNNANQVNDLYINGENNFKSNYYSNDIPNKTNIYTNDNCKSNLYANDHKRPPSSMGANRTIRKIKRFNSCDIEGRKTLENINTPLYMNDNNFLNFNNKHSENHFDHTKTCKKKILVSRYQEILNPDLGSIQKSSTYNTVSAAQIIKSRLIKPKTDENKFSTCRTPVFNPNITTFKLQPFGVKKICKKNCHNS